MATRCAAQLGIEDATRSQSKLPLEIRATEQVSTSFASDWHYEKPQVGNEIRKQFFFCRCIVVYKRYFCEKTFLLIKGPSDESKARFLESLWIPGGAPKTALGDIFGQKGTLTGSPEPGWAPWSRPRQDLVQKASQASFWNHFGSILEQVCMHFGLI